MIQKLSSKLKVQIDTPNEEKLQNINFQHVVDEPDENAVLTLGEIMTTLSPEGSSLDGVVLTSQKPLYEVNDGWSYPTEKNQQFLLSLVVG